MIQGKASIIGGKELEQQNELLLLEKAHKLLSDKYLATLGTKVDLT
jgi:hypothetical protein